MGLDNVSPLDLFAAPPAPGLLRVLRQAVAARLGVLLAGIVFYAAILPDRSVWLMFLLAAEPAALLGLITWPPMQRMLGRWFLPLALGWFALAPMAGRALILLFVGSETIFSLGQLVLENLGIITIWLVIPVVLAAWQYGRWGLRLIMALLILEHGLMGVLVATDLPAAAGYVLTAGGRLVMMGILGYVVVRLVEAQQREHRALQAANRQLAQRAATVEQLAESRERNRLARELHDTLAHSLTGLSVQLQALGTLLAHDPAAAQAQLRAAQATVRGGIQESRRAIQALRATPLEDLGLSEALRQLVRQHAERTGITCTCDIADVAALDPVTEQTLYRVAEAALANIEQHAAATAMQVRLCTRTANRGLRLEISDNGVGFDPAAAFPDRFGLAGMAERAKLIGAELTIESGAGQGTRVTLET